MEIRRPGLEAHHSSAYSAEGKNAWSYESTPPNVFMIFSLDAAQRQNFLYFFCQAESSSYSEGSSAFQRRQKALII
jgi:hypothetical protein